MRVLVDTPIWSAALRRADGQPAPYRDEMAKLVAQGGYSKELPIRLYPFAPPA